MKSSEFARLTGVTLKTLRHYHKIGLLDEPDRRENGYRDYDVTHVIRLLRIRHLASVGLSLARIKEQLDAEDRAAAERAGFGWASVACGTCGPGAAGERGAGMPGKCHTATPSVLTVCGAHRAGSAESDESDGMSAGAGALAGTVAVVPEVLDELDAALADQIARLQGQRRLIASLRSQALDLDVPEPFRAHLARLREYGAGEDFLSFERGNLMLLGSLYDPREVEGAARFYEELAARGEVGRYLALNERLLALASDAGEGERAALVDEAVVFATALFEGLGADATLWEPQAPDFLLDDYEVRRLNAAQADVSARIWRALSDSFAARDARA